MKHHIAFKFIAIVLCAAALLGAIGSGIGVFTLTALNLYDETVDDVHQGKIQDFGSWFSHYAASCYASQALGNCPEEMAYQNFPYNQYFRSPYYSYTIIDAEGTVVASSENAIPDGTAAVYTFPASGKYMYLVADQIPVPTEAPVIACEGLAMDPAPISFSEIGETYQLSVTPVPEFTTDEIRYYSLNESIASVDETGLITAVAQGETKIIVTCGNFKLERNIVLRLPAETTATIPTTEPFQYDAWDDETWERIQNWIQEEWSKDAWENEKWDDMAAWVEENWDEDEWTDDQWAQLHHWIEDEWNKEVPPTVPETVPETQAPTEETVPAVAAAEPATGSTPSETMAPPTDSDPSEPILINGRPLSDYELYHTSYYDHNSSERMQAQYVLLDLPEYTVELRLLPGALQEDAYLPLLYALYSCRNQMLPILGLCLLIFAVLAVYLCCTAGRSPKSTEVRAGGLNRLPLELYGGITFLTTIFVVAFSVEFLQFNQGWNMQMVFTMIALAAYVCCLMVVGFFYALAAQVKTPGRFWLKNSLCGHCVRLLLWAWHQFAKLFPTFGRWISAAWQWVKKVVCFVCVRFARLFTMLPLVWQWLIIGMAMLLFLIIGLFTENGWLLILAAIADGLVVLYGAYAFGRLLDGTKRMSSGDLDTRIEDRHLLGGFRLFAQNLNALAAVAREAAQKQLKSERMKTELITNVSHDIKTPLTSIINYVDLLQKPHTPEEQEQYLDVLARQSQQLKKLIEDLMDMSKASTGNMTVDITQVDAVESVNQALGEFSDKLDKALLTPVFRHDEDSINMMADGRLTWRVLSNLLGNAVKYALPGTRLYIDLMQLDGKVLLSMKNVSRDELNIDADELMERFVRGDCSRNTEGSGLGLNIAKSMMELQHGQLELLIDGDLFKVTLIFPSADH